MSEAFEYEGESVFSPTSDGGGNEIAFLALLVPVLAGSVLFFVNSMPLALSIAGATVLATTILMAVDFSRFPAVDSDGRARESAWPLALGMCALWLVGFPYAFFRRQAFRRPRLGFLSVMVAAYFGFGPLVYSLMVPPELPSCTSSEVVALLEKVLRDTSAGAAIQAIDGHHEISFDKEQNVRHGRCLLHSQDGDTEVDYFVEWQDRERGMFQVRIAAKTLPPVTSPQVVQTLEQYLRSTPNGSRIRSIDSHREVSIDETTGARHGVCVAHTDNADEEIRFWVEWKDRDKGSFQVQVITAELPLCDSTQIVALVEQLFRDTTAGANVTSLDGHQEVQFDEKAGIRFGRCLSHSDSGDAEVRYLVEWQDREKGQFRVRIPPTELPSCTSPEVIEVLEELISRNNAGARELSVDGHLEIRVDPEGKTRLGSCTVNIDGQIGEVQYLVEWLNRDTGYFGVRIVQPSAI